jgi:hypothetical protein
LSCAADRFLFRVIKGLAALRYFPGSTSADCPLFSNLYDEDKPLRYFWGATAPDFKIYYGNRQEVQMTFHELLHDSSLYLSEEPCNNYGYLYSHEGQQRMKAYRKACITVSFPIEQSHSMSLSPSDF